MTVKLDKALEAVRSAVQEAVDAAYERGKSDAGRDAIARMSAALGVAQQTRRGRKPKEIKT